MSMRARRSALVGLVVAGILLPCVTATVSAETYEQAMERRCPNGKAIAALERQAKEADALLDNRRFSIHRSIARELFRCASSDAADSYTRDIAMVFYGSHMLRSAKTNGDGERIGFAVGTRMNDLAAATHYPDIRKIALEFKADALQEARDSHEAIYGTPEPAPTDQPTP